jgi:O-antigen ligase
MFAMVFLIIMVLSFGYALALPLYGRMQVDFPGAWRGVYDHKNALGYAMSVALVIFLGAFVFNPRQRPLWAAAGAAAIVLLILSTSKTALVSGGVAIVALTLPIVGRRSPAAAIAATLAAGTGFYLLLMVLAVDVGPVFALLGKDQSFTGRTRIWAVVSKEIAQNPLFGFGYGAIWENRDVWSPLLAMEKSLGFILPEAHNSWLQIALDLGYVGAALWTAVFLGSWLRTLAFLYTRPASLFIFPFLIVFTLHALTEAGALLQNDIVWILFTLITVRLGDEHRLLTPRTSSDDALGGEPAPLLWSRT